MALRKVVIDEDLMPLLAQGFDYMTPDIPCPAGNQYFQRKTP